MAAASDFTTAALGFFPGARARTGGAVHLDEAGADGFLRAATFGLGGVALPPPAAARGRAFAAGFFADFIADWVLFCDGDGAEAAAFFAFGRLAVGFRLAAPALDFFATLFFGLVGMNPVAVAPLSVAAALTIASMTAMAAIAPIATPRTSTPCRLTSAKRP